MQKQQRDTQAVFFEKRIKRDDLGWDEVPVTMEKYKIKEDKTFMDGFKLLAGETLRKVVGSKEECEYLNVIFEGDHTVKRMFWIQKSELDFVSSNTETWNRSDFENETKDSLENWFE